MSHKYSEWRQRKMFTTTLIGIKFRIHLLAACYFFSSKKQIDKLSSLSNFTNGSDIQLFTSSLTVSQSNHTSSISIIFLLENWRRYVWKYFTKSQSQWISKLTETLTFAGCVFFHAFVVVCWQMVWIYQQTTKMASSKERVKQLR